MNRSRLGQLVLLALTGACRDVPFATVPMSPSAPAERTAVRCSVDVAARTLGCGARDGMDGSRGNIMLGGQGVNVRLASSNVRYANGSLQAEVTVQNLLDQPMGTDGTDTVGVRVFFGSGPTVTQGSGAVTVLADGTGTFTASGQPFYTYPGLLEPQGISQRRTWTFALDPGVIRFEFTVFVDTRLPGEASILHWRPEQAPVPYKGRLQSVFALSERAVYAVGDDAVLYFNGDVWRSLPDISCTCNGIWAASENDVFAVGNAGTMRHWPGGRWEAINFQDRGRATDFYGVWGFSPNDVWAVGTGGEIAHFDGTRWTSFQSDSLETETLMSVWGSSPSDVWVVGEGRARLHWDGTRWSRYDDLHFGSLTLYSVWGTASDDVWAAGYFDTFGGPGVVYHYDGTAWRQVNDVPDLPLYFHSGWSTSRNDVWIANISGAVVHYDGTGWSVTPPAPPLVNELSGTIWGLTATSPDNVIEVGERMGLREEPTGGYSFYPVILRNRGAGWERMGRPADRLSGLWGSSASNVWAVGDSSLRHWTGEAWVSQPTPAGMTLSAVWGSAAADVWAVGDSGIAHYDGASWSLVNSPQLPLSSVWGASANDVWAGGTGKIAHWNGTAWTVASLGTARFTGIWGSAAADVFAVGTGGTIRHWNGSAWTPMSSGTLATLYGVWGTGSDNVYAVGMGVVLHYDGGASATWAAVATPANPTLPIEAIWGSGPDDIFILADAGASLLHWDGAAWRKLTSFPSVTPAPMHALWGSGRQNVYVAGDSGTILHGRR